MNVTATKNVMMAAGIGLASAIGMAVWMAVGAAAFAQPEKSDIIFLLGGACEKQDMYVRIFPDAYVVCSPETMWQGAHVRYSGFEQVYKVIYVVNSHTISAHNEGYAWWDGVGHGYAEAQEFPEVVRHELQHLDCQCLNTPDGVHRFGDNIVR